MSAIAPDGPVAPRNAPMIDPFGRPITYLRVSVTDRCDFRCVYCMAGTTAFLPKAEVLTLEELDRLCSAFVGLGVRKLRLTGGEPLIRRGVMTLVRALGRHLGTGALDELTLTTNGGQLARHAGDLAASGVRRINVSLDSLRPERFRDITRGGRLEPVLAGIDAARAAGLEVKLNCAALRGVNEDEFDDLLGWCGEHGCDLTLIELMPLGGIDGRAERYLPLTMVRERLERRWTLEDLPPDGGGPARRVRVLETGRRLGFIAPHTGKFCGSCDRVRLTCAGTLFPCLGHAESTDLRAALRAHPGDAAALVAAIRASIARKPESHAFTIDRPAVARFMNETGG